MGQGYRRGGGGAQKSQLQELKPPPISDPPDPQELQDRNKEKPVQEVKCLSSVMEERTAAPKACQSQSTSTFKASVNHHPSPNSLLETMPWRPPGS